MDAAAMRLKAAVVCAGVAGLFALASEVARRRRKPGALDAPTPLDVRLGLTTLADGRKPLRWAFLSCGRVAHDYANALKCVEGAVLHCVATRAEKDRDAEADRVAHVTQILEAGKHCVVEKPFACNLADGKKIVDLARRRKVFVMEGMWTRCFPAVEKARELVDAGAIGAVTAVLSDFGFDAADSGSYPADPKDATSGDPIYHKAIGGGALLWAGPYPIAAGFLPFGATKPKSVAAAGTLDPNTGVDLSCSLSLTYANAAGGAPSDRPGACPPRGATVSLYTSIDAETAETTTYVGQKGRVVVLPPAHCPTKLRLELKAAGRGNASVSEVEYAFPAPSRPFAPVAGGDACFHYPNSHGFCYEAAAVQRCVNAGLTECPQYTPTRRLRSTSRTRRDACGRRVTGGPMARAAFYPADGPVATLDPYNFDAFVEAAPLTIVEFYAPWCGHCQQVAPRYLAAAAALSEKHGGRVAFGAMDESDEGNRRLRAGSEDMYDFKHYPALVVFYGREGGLSIGRQLLASDGLHGPKKDAATWDRYYGARSGRSSSGSRRCSTARTPSSRRTVLKPGLYRDDARNDGLVEELDAEGLASIAKGARDVNAVWVVEFYSDRCPHCKTLVPEMISAAEKLRKSLGKTQVRVAAINARVFFRAAKGRSGKGKLATRGDDDVPDDGLTPTCRNADICTCSNDPPTCRCAPSAYSRGCCNMNCGDCGDLCAALSGKKKKPPKEPPVVEKKDAAKKEPPVVEKWPGKWEKKDAVAVDAAGGAAAAPANGAAWREARRAWFYLHTFAAKYPDAPTEADKVAARWQVASLAQHYPCHVCRGHLQKKLLSKALGPVDVDGREKLSTWMCRLHNLVNADLGKPAHACGILQLDAIYLKDCGDCKAGSAFPGGKGEAAGERPFFAAAYAADPALYVGARVVVTAARFTAPFPPQEAFAPKSSSSALMAARSGANSGVSQRTKALAASPKMEAAIPGDEDFDFDV
ncbi:D-xylose 1-dehydrogenase [Aureococcus anophagefferens]|nr:D-xylose 1-dehydrogenase [Aureococcus anophagefferens]